MNEILSPQEEKTKNNLENTVETILTTLKIAPQPIDSDLGVYIQTIGLAGCGKTTLCRKLHERAGFIRVSHDDLIPFLTGGTYNYGSLIRVLPKGKSTRDIEIAILKELIRQPSLRRIIHDRTFLSKILRQQYIKIVDTESSRVGISYMHVAIYFAIPKEECIRRRQHSPYVSPLIEKSPYIDWEEVINGQSKRLKIPTLEEGYDCIFTLGANYELVDIVKK